jgi:xanthine dehydrogenase molybdenum-binding subunit
VKKKVSNMTKTITKRPGRKYIGSYSPKYDGYEKATGRTLYFDDIAIKSRAAAPAVCRIFESPYANAKISRMETGKAEAYPGVYAVIRYDDPEILKLKPFTHCWTNNQLSPYHIVNWSPKVFDRRILGDEARWVGEEMGVAVAAESEDIAQKALSLIDIEWEFLGDIMIEVEDAMKPGARILHPEINPNSNEMPRGGKLPVDDEVPFEKGDVDGAFAGADEIVEVEKTLGGSVIPGRLDRYGGMVSWEGDKLDVWAGHFYKDQLRLILHAMLDIPMSKIRVRTTNVGGSFGKSNMGEQGFYIINALLSKRIGRPVKYRNDMRSEFAEVRNKVTWHLKMGATKDGMITAMDFTGTGNGGCYAAVIEAVVGYFVQVGSEATFGHIPNVRMRYRNFYTNRLPGGIMRGIGNIQLNFVIIQAVDMLAEKLNMDPVELAEKNFGDQYSDLPNVSLSTVLREGAAMVGWENRHGPGEGSLHDGTKKKGIGMSFWNQWHAEWQQKERGRLEVLIRLNPDLSVILDAPTCETGNGANSSSVLACAEALDFLRVTPSRIEWVSIGDTETGLRDCHPTDSSVGLLHAELIAEAGKMIKNELLDRASTYLSLPVEELEIENAVVYSINDREKNVQAEHLIMDNDAVPISAHAIRTPNLTITGLPFGAWFIEVSVDIETGKIEVDKIVILNDGGTILHASGVESQQIGGQTIALGETLFEEIAYDKKTGVALNTNFIDYKMPTILDIPDIDPVPMEVWQGAGEYGAAGLAEGTACGTPAAIANAVYNAVGIRLDELPFKPEKVLEKLAESSNEERR